MALQGTLDTFALADLIRLLATTNKTGELSIDGDRGHGSLWFVDGALVAGDPAGDDVTDAVFALLRMEEGDFSFSAETRADEEHEPQSALDVLGVAEGRLEEWRPVETLVPTPAVTLTLREDLPADEVTVTRDVWRQLVVVGGGTTARAFGAALDLDEVATGFAVHGLVEAGLVEVGEPAEAVEAEPRAEGTEDIGATLVADEVEAADGTETAEVAPDGAEDLAEVVALTPEPYAEVLGDDERFRLGDWEDPEVVAQPLLPPVVDAAEDVDAAEVAASDGLGPWEPLTPQAIVDEAEAEAAHQAAEEPEVEAEPATETAEEPEVETETAEEPEVVEAAAVTDLPVDAVADIDEARPVDTASLDVDLDRQLGGAPSGHSYLAGPADVEADVLPEPLLAAPGAILPAPVAPAEADAPEATEVGAADGEADEAVEAPDRSWADSDLGALPVEALSPAAARALAAAAASDAGPAEGDADAGRRVLRRIISTGKA